MLEALEFTSILWNLASAAEGRTAVGFTSMGDPVWADFLALMDDEQGRLPIHYDVDGDIAAVLSYLDWAEGVGDVYHFRRTKHGWRELGVGSGGPFPRPSAVRPTADVLGVLARVDAGTGTNLRSDLPFPWPSRWMHSNVLQVAAEVGSLRVGNRLIAVPENGRMIVVWTGRRPPAVQALDTNDDVLAELPGLLKPN
jgi:hypothetical protein